MRNKKQQRKIVYIDRELPASITLRAGQELVLANSYDNFKRNYMIVTARVAPEEDFTAMAIAGSFHCPDMLDGTYVASLLVATNAGAEGQLSIGLGYAHIQTAEETKSLRYKILPKKKRATRKGT